MWKAFHYSSDWENLRCYRSLSKIFDTRRLHLWNWALSNAPTWFMMRIFISASENKFTRLFKLDTILCISCGMSGGTMPLAKVRNTDMETEGRVYSLVIINFVDIKFLTLKREASIHWEKVSGLFLWENVLPQCKQIQELKNEVQKCPLRHKQPN